MRDAFPEFEMYLSRLEHLLSTSGRAKAPALKEGRMMLRHLLADLMHGSKMTRALGPEMHESLYMLMRRAEKANTSDAVREVARDFRQYMMAATSFSRAKEMEDRLRELEGQMKSAAEGAAADGMGQDDVVTLDSLRDKKVLFAIMPFHDDFRDVWAGGIKRAAAGTGVTPIRIDMITASTEITDDIVAAIELAEIVVVDVTQNNPNVMFEFGFALAKQKAHVVISQSTEFLTFDIKNVRTIIYKNSWQGIEGLHKDLQSFIKGTIGRAGKAGKAAAKAG